MVVFPNRDAYCGPVDRCGWLSEALGFAPGSGEVGDYRAASGGAAGGVAAVSVAGAGMKNVQPRLHSVLAASILALACFDTQSCAGMAPKGGGSSGIPIAKPESVKPTESDRERIIREAAKLVGTREATGRNDGPIIDAILDSVGLKGTRSPYCAAFNRFVYDQAALRNVGPRSAWSPDWVANPTWKQGNGREPRPGDAWGIYFKNKGRVAHTGLVEKWGGQVVMTIEGNTSPDASVGSEADRNGDGIWRKRRLIRQIYSVRDWIGGP